MWIVKMKPVLGQATDQMIDLLINVVQLAENLLGKLSDGFCLLPSFRHGENGVMGFNKLCGESVRWASSSAMRLPAAVSR